jgi:hypothetical protein
MSFVSSFINQSINQPNTPIIISIPSSTPSSPLQHPTAHTCEPPRNIFSISLPIHTSRDVASPRFRSTNFVGLREDPRAGGGHALVAESGYRERDRGGGGDGIRGEGGGVSGTTINGCFCSVRRCRCSF